MAQTLIEFKKFLAKFHIEVPTGFDVQVVLDNASTDKTPAVKRRLAAHTPVRPALRPDQVGLAQPG